MSFATLPASRILAQADTLVVDSGPALAFARESGLAATAKIFSAAPALARKSGVTPLEVGVSSEDIHRLSGMIGQMSRDIYRVVGAHGAMAARATTFARLTVRIENLAYKAWLLSRAELGTSIALVEHPAVMPSIKSGWGRLLSNLPEFRGRIELPSARLPPISAGHNTVPPMGVRLRFETWQSIVFRLAMNLPGWLKKMLGRRGDVLVVSENGLIKESGTYLALSGFSLRRLQAPARERRLERLPEDLTLQLSALVEKMFAAELGNPVYVQALTLAYIEVCEEALGEYTGALAHWKKQLSLIPGRRPKMVLTNFNATPTGEALFELCKEANILHACSQHGTGVELCLAGQHHYQYGEAANSGLYFTYNEAAAGLVKGFGTTRAEVISVGQPRDLAEVGRHRRGSGPEVDVHYVSNQALFGHVLPPSSAGISESEAVAWESGIVKEVLARLPHRVLYKPYRAMFYLDQSPLHVSAAEQLGIQYYEEYLDLRYMLPNARVLVLTHAASTLSWCLMSTKPVVYINAPDQAQLYPDFEAGMRQGGIVVDADAPDFIEQLRGVLSQPIEAIEAEWRAKADIRRRVLERFIGKADGKAGRRMADAIWQRALRKG
jgi:hypothetical protein